MKAALALASVVALTQAQTVQTTNNECWKGEGGEYRGDCRDVYFNTCDEYVVFGDSSCNVFTFSDSRITWKSSMITAYYWEYYQKNDFDSSLGKVTGDDFSSSGRCTPSNDIPTGYSEGLYMNYTDGMCGFKYQLTNSDTVYENKFQVLKDGASTLFAGAAFAITAVLAF